MPWRGPAYPGEFPTLGFQIADLIQAKCAIPDGDHAGEPFILTDEQLRFVLFHYRINPETGRFFYTRGSQLVRPQKWGKGPFSAAFICAECDPDGPVRFAGWDANGEPVGRPWGTPWWQVTALVEDQTDNVWKALVPMIERGALAADIPDTGETRINLPSGGFIEPVTSHAPARLGQRITGAVQDETHAWIKVNHRRLADTQRRNLAGTGGRFLETTNAWDPGENSVAQHTGEGNEPGVYRDDVESGSGSIRNKAERRKMLKRVYGDSWWVDLERIDEEIVALLARDPVQAERYFLNRKRASEDSAFDPEVWKVRQKLFGVALGAPIAIGVDGARFVDALAIIATEIATGFQWPVGIWERPEGAPDNYEHPQAEVDAAMCLAFEHFNVVRAHVDPQYIEHLLDIWQGRWGNKRVLTWLTNRWAPMAWAVRNYTAAIASGDQSHDGDPRFAVHIANAKKRKVQVFDDQHRQMHVLTKDRADSPRKIDAAVAGTLSWEARGDAIASGALEVQPEVERDWFMF